MYCILIFYSDGISSFDKMDDMTCSPDHRTSSQSLTKILEKVKSECSMQENCTAVITDQCSTVHTYYNYEFCYDEPIPKEQSGPYSYGYCVYKKPDGTFIFII